MECLFGGVKQSGLSGGLQARIDEYLELKYVLLRLIDSLRNKKGGLPMYGDMPSVILNKPIG